ncbi:DNA metabolism protein [Lithospermum erythrorhizon]|uniref:DNA mismatch repair protein n=1 Tax=Lithospermum erythrorhizon TaxID=34254 RepID=A0AAV3NKJ8_LITER
MSRRSTNGRSPLVNPQRQITTFFTKMTSPQSSPFSVNSTPPASDTVTITPEAKTKKPRLVIERPVSLPMSPEGGKKVYGEEVVGRRVRVYWPLDKSWYEGVVKSFDGSLGKHLVQYDDAEEEMLCLLDERIEWVDVEVRRFRRLRRVGVVVDDEEGNEEFGSGGDGDGDNSEDEDWGKSGGKEEIDEEEGDVLEDMDLVDEEDDDDEGGDSNNNNNKRNVGFKVESKKRKASEVAKLECKKKNKSGYGEKKQASNGKVLEPPAAMLDCDKSPNSQNKLMGDVADRFGLREAEKLSFLVKNRRDANKRCPADVNYDPKTLFLPHWFLNNLTGGQRQWWEFKSKHMDKVLFFKMGKFYELFEMDAHIGAKELDLQYMKGDQPHCGFPEKNFLINSEKLARKGYRVLVVEQTETPQQLDLRRKEKGSKDKVVKREICAVVTKGTLTEGESLAANPDASYLMSLTESFHVSENQEERAYGVCCVDVTTSKIILGQFKDDSDCSALSSLLSELRPVEIIKPAKLLSDTTERVLLRHTRNPLINELIPVSEFWDADKTVKEIKGIYNRISNKSLSSFNKLDIDPVNSSTKDDDFEHLPGILSELVASGEDGSHALSALGGILFYLKQALLDENLLRFAKFEPIPCSGFGGISKKSYMVLDAASLESLEIFENSRNGGSAGALYGQLNHCVTAFGKRLLKAWVARPLYDLQLLRERQDAVTGLRGSNLQFVLEFRRELSVLPDMERLLARIFASSEANGRNATKVVLYEDASKKKLQEFISMLRGCEVMIKACSSLSIILENTDSALLHHLLIPGKGSPDVHSILQSYKDAFDWTEADSSGRIIPREGADVEYDEACKTIRDIECDLSKHLKEQKKLLGDPSINYVTIGKDTYLLEVPESLCESVPREYELCSSKKGFFRYWTPVTKKLIRDLSQAESEKESKLKSILQRLIGRFCAHHNQWRQLISATAELDALISLSVASDFYDRPTCRPVISTESTLDNVPELSARSLGHPVLGSDSLAKGSFVPNDVTLGGSDNSSFILLTGPNMGGKSTLLRQICLAVILAQIGADVPAESFKMSPVDRIFVRMGAKDHIMAGQSTFLTELLETSSMLSSATRSSLVALDELGRGTSTSDGQALAESVLEHFVTKVRCRGMFSTHYHRLAVNYQKSPKVSLCHMACHVGKGSQGLEEVTFLYRLTPGACPKSYGVNVARLAGLPDTVLRCAAAKSKEFEVVYGKHDKSDGIFFNQSWKDEIIRVIQKLAKGSNNSNFMLDSLKELQQRARKLIEQK